MRRYWTSLACFLVLVAVQPLRSQHPQGNLVYNASFEEHHECPKKIEALGVMREVDAWWQPTGGSSDYFNACGGRECTVPRNKMGFQPAHSGEAYCGIYCSQEMYREYLQTELMAPLAAGRRYRVSFWVSLAEKSPHATSAIGAVLSRQRLQDTTHGILMQREVDDLDEGSAKSIAIFLTPQIANAPERTLNDTKEWTEVSGEFVATGGERFLTIGNFLPFNKSRVVATDGSNTPLPGAYYYVDDVSVRCLDSAGLAVPPPVPLPAEGATIVMSEVFFDTGESEVLQQSYRELRILADMLRTHPSMRIELRGHTDNRGTIDYNMKLSTARAKAVADCLMRMGAGKEQLTWQGFGKSVPIADNDSAEGRRKNRRVEYRVVAH